MANKIATIGGLLTARCDRPGLQASNRKQLGASFFLFWKISSGIVQISVKTWKWSLANYKSPKISPGLPRENFLQVLVFKAEGSQKEGEEHSAGNFTLIMEIFPNGPLSVSHVWAREERRQIASYFISREPANILGIKPGKLQAANRSSPGLSQISQASRDCWPCSSN